MSTDQPRILIGLRELGIGGTERQACVVARLLQSRGYRVTVGCFVAEGLRRQELDDAGVEVHKIEVNSFASWRSVAEAWRTRRWIRDREIQLVHCFDYPTAIFFAAAFAPGKPIPLVTSLRMFRSLLHQPYRWMLQQAERISDRIVVNSDEVRQDLIQREKMDASRLRLLYNAVDPDEFPPPESLDPRPRPPELAEAALVIGCVCGIRVEKDLPTLMRAFAVLRNEHPGIRLALVGSGPAEPQIEALRIDLALQEVCVLIPQTRDTQTWLAAIDIFVLPSLSEALSNALLEAMSSECAAVASRIGGNVEIIEDGINGHLFPAGNVAALTEKLRALIVDKDARLRLAEAGRRSVQERFSPEAAARTITAIYRELL